MNHTVSQVIDLAADYIQANGWIQDACGWAWDKNPTYALCLEGAIQAASGLTVADTANGAFGGLYDCPAYQAVAAYLERDVAVNDYEMPAQPLWQWNDRVAKSAEDVIAVLRAAAAVQRAREDADQLTFQFNAA